jgi:drug/metabolite transporter (DMT)-like permease
MKREKLIHWVLFVILSVIWGSSFILMKVSKEVLNGYQIGAVRIFAAGLVFLPFALSHFSKIPRNKLMLVILSGLIGNFLPAFLFAIAIEHKIGSSLAGILNSLTPLFVILLSLLFFKAKVQQRKIIGVVIGFAGLLVLSLSKGGISLQNLDYALLILLATLLYGINVNLVSYYLKGIDPFHMATVSLAAMGLLAGIIVWQQDVAQLLSSNPNAMLPVVYAALLGIIGSALATLLFYILIKKAGGLFASLVTYGIPVVAICWGIVANENVTWIQVGCLSVILGGVYLANRA